MGKIILHFSPLTGRQVIEKNLTFRKEGGYYYLSILPPKRSANRYSPGSQETKFFQKACIASGSSAAL